MNKKSFIRRAQKLIIKAVKIDKYIDCTIRKSLIDGSLNFEVIHFDARYGSDNYRYNSRTLSVYINHDTEKGFSEAENFLDRLLSGEDILIEPKY